MMPVPVWKNNDKGVNVSVWENVRPDGTKARSVTIQKRYKDKQGEWRTSQSYFESDVAVLVSLLKEAEDFMRR